MHQTAASYYTAWSLQAQISGASAGQATEDKHTSTFYRVRQHEHQRREKDRSVFDHRPLFQSCRAPTICINPEILMLHLDQTAIWILKYNHISSSCSWSNSFCFPVDLYTLFQSRPENPILVDSVMPRNWNINSSMTTRERSALDIFSTRSNSSFVSTAASRQRGVARCTGPCTSLLRDCGCVF